ncbi:MFS transporter [Rhizobium mongolense]|uniref:DHA2 family multidrug resistance protein-like MFS transporter n=2 Tax=Rhizobium mongolense TaxID=57676 RepID=A0ABR6IZ32_9HYPH|nr:MFS transporter [Rhizobium mongolense]MBB4232803.1 DHA2 family multidrug resistance protein-like MFS transporter [Rhizobium mongolense]TVZ72730.1 DHA2 family multidrug resistance protein-like MFS transporter [Rhizobium mongolense USDA 1844]
MQEHLAEKTQSTAGSREWTGLYVLSIACLIYSMDLSVLFLAMPAIVSDLDPSASELLWINDIYGFMVSGFLVTMGTLGDRIGRRRVLLIGAFAFAVASSFAAAASTPQQLIIARALLGVAGATIAPSTLSLVVNLFQDEAERNRAISIWGTAFALGGLVGPLLGGALLEYFHWGSVFLINIPAMMALLIAAPFLLPEYRNDEGGKIDLPSVLLSLATVLPIIYGFKHMAADGFKPGQLLPIVVGFLVGIVFVRRQKRLVHPLIDLGLFGVPSFTASLMVNLAGVFFVFGIFLFQNLFLQLVLGLSPLGAALWSVPSALVFTVMSFQAYRFTNRFGPVDTVIGGLIVNAVGTTAMAAAAYAESLIGILMASMLIGLGFVPVILTTTGLIVSTAPPERAGSASAISETSAEFGGALGIALLGSLGTLVYRMTMDQVNLSGFNEAQVVAISATLAGAVEIARTLGESAELPWLEAAKRGFALGFAACCALASVTLLILAAVARNVYASGAIDENDAPR